MVPFVKDNAVVKLYSSHALLSIYYQRQAGSGQYTSQDTFLVFLMFMFAFCLLRPPGPLVLLDCLPLGVFSVDLPLSSEDCLEARPRSVRIYLQLVPFFAMPFCGVCK